MTDEQLLISLIGTRRARHEQSLREQLGWTGSRFRAALDSLTGRGLIRQEDGGFVRTIPQLSEPAQRILSALPESGARRSGSPLARQLGMQLSDYRDARDELKTHLLVTTGQGRGAGSIARLASDRSHFEERVREGFTRNCGLSAMSTSRNRSCTSCNSRVTSNRMRESYRASAR